MKLDREQFIRDAWKLEGSAFLHQGTDPAVGIDCIHAPAHLARLQGYELPFEMPRTYRQDSHNSKLIEAILRAHFVEVSAEAARAGDLYLFKPAISMRHLGIRLADTQPPLILQPSSEPRPGYPHGRLTVEPFADRWKRIFRGAFRFPDFVEGA
jgi:hypothetical protein